MNILSRLQIRMGHFLLSHLLTREIVNSWKSQFVQDPLPDISAPTPANTMQDTDKISEVDLKKALKEHRESREIPGLYPPRATLANGMVAGTRYRDHQRRVEMEETRELSAVQIQEKLLGMLGGEEG